MIGTPREITLEMFKCSDLDGEKCVFACWYGADIRSICLDWDLSDEDVKRVLERLNAQLECGGDFGPIRGIVDDFLDEKRALRTVTIPATSLELVMQLAGKEMELLTLQGEIGALKETNDVMQDLRRAINV